MKTVVMRERPTDYLVANNPSKVWISSADGGPVEVLLPRVIAGNVAGWSGESKISIPVDQVQELRARRLDPLKTSLLAGAVLAAGGGVVLWRLSKPKTPTGCEYFNGMEAEEVEETGTLGICSM